MFGISTICLRLFFLDALISNENPHFWTDTNQGVHMQQILSAQAKEGMVLAKDVELPDGRILCGKGTTLVPSVIARFLKLDIAHIMVEGHPIAVEGEKTLKEELRDMEERFSEVTKIPPLMYIKKRLMHNLIKSRS